mmetsp:Transcript_22654/g.55917  ORF Transcript_22654/g.55917 Transcript_22654/m.55917 type:complete len:250 (-) Transcript_22654:377-1126(-)
MKGMKLCRRRAFSLSKRAVFWSSSRTICCRSPICILHMPRHSWSCCTLFPSRSIGGSVLSGRSTSIMVESSSTSTPCDISAALISSESIDCFARHWRACSLLFLHTASRLNLISLAAYFSMRCARMGLICFHHVSLFSTVPSRIGPSCRPSSSYSFPSMGMYAVKWYTSSSLLALLSSISNGSGRAKLLCVVRIVSLLLMLSPLRSAGKSAVKALKSESSAPSWIPSAFIMMLSSAWVPQALLMTCLAK